MLCVDAAISVAESLVATPDIRVKEICNYQAFLDLEPVWNRVVEAAALGNPFLEFSWARSWWECFGKGNALYVLVLWAGDDPIAIAPLMATSLRMYGLSIRRLGFLYNSHVPRADFIIATRPTDA